MNDIELAKMLFGDSNTTVSSESSLVPGRTRTYTAIALADSENGYVLVQVNGEMVTGSGQSSMRLPTQAIVKAGDVVNITVVNGSPVVTGAAGWGDMVGNTIVAQNAQIQNLQASKASIDVLDAQVARIDDLTADFADIETLVADKADISVLQAEYAHITNGIIDNATIDAADVNDLSANYAHITNGVIDNANIDYADVNNLSANYAHISNGVIDNATIGVASVNDLSANYAHISNGTIDNANISYANVNELSANYAQLNMANVNNGWIENGTIRDGAISNAMIASVSANKLTAGTIDASNITVTNLNADNITTGTINGQRIGAGSLSLDKLSEDVYTESEIDGIVSDLQDQIDGAIETWTGSTVPTLNNSPASSWTTNAIRDTHVGDVYFVVNSQSQQNGYNYRFTKSGNTYSWQLIKDNDVTQALQRLTTAEGKISTIESFDSEISSWKTDTDEELTSVKSRTTSLETRVTSAEGDISTKVDTTTFNTLSQTVDGNTSSISTLSTITTNNGLTSTTNITNTVNTVSNTATSNSTKISQLTTTLGTNADGTSKEGDIIHRTTAVETDLNGFKTTVSSTYATQTALGGVEATANNANNKLVAYSGTCSTSASTAAKVVACQNFVLSAGTAITIRFSTSNTSNGAITLNVNSTGAKTVYVNGATTGSSNQLLWATNANITFTYDGTYWRVDSEPRTWYGSCSIAAGTAAKTASINEAVICKGTQVVLNMTYENTSTSATLNVTSVGAKNIYYGTTTTRPTTSNGYGWTANSTATFVFDGAYWRIGDTSAMAKITATNSVVAQHTTKIDQNAEAIALKADSSTTYTKTDVDGLISTEVTNRNAAITASANAINLSVSETYATIDDVDGIETRVSTAESSISQNAENIELKVSKNGVISSINASPESVTINANRVNISGAAIFTSGRLSESSLNNTYATPDDIPTNISDLENDSGFQTSSQVESAITSKGYQTASQVESAITGKGYATTAQANAEEQLIYRSAVAGTNSMSKTTTWISASGDTQNAWTTKRPTYSASYPVLFVATQRKSVSGTVSCTTPVKDDTTTVIDGGHITTGTIDASVATITNINANNITAGTLSVDRINANSITLNKISTDAQDAILNENVIVGGKNLLWLSSLIVVGGGPDDKDVNSGWVSDTTPTGDTRSWSYANSNWVVDLDAGDYILSWDVLDNNATTNTSQGIRLFKQDGTTIWASGSDYPFNTPGHKTHSFKMESAATVGIMFKLYDAVARFKLEAGTNGTDWTPAPEDVTSNISSINSKLTETISGLEEAVNTSVSDLADDVSNANDRLDTLDVVVDGKLDAGYLKSWLDATPDELTLGRESTTGTTVKAVLDAEKLAFKVGNEVVATYGGTAGMSVPKATVDNSLTIGGFIWTTSDGHLTLKYVG